ncbi:MAG: alpha/beta hydrolase [Propionibacteriaceae bacterium]
MAGLLAVAALFASGLATPAEAGGRHPKPTIVLVHGAWADASSWGDVVPRLQREGYTVVAPPNPLRGLTSDAAYIKTFLSTISGPIVLAGHSYGGAVITNAATGNPNVKALVYVNAFAPKAGENVFTLSTAQPGSYLDADPATIFNLVPLPDGSDVDVYIKPEVFVPAFANDLPRRQGRALAAEQRPITFGGGGQASGTPAWKTIPSWYLVGTIDNVIPAAQQRIMAARAHAHTTEVKAGHLSMLSKPKAVAKVIDQAARATR